MHRALLVFTAVLALAACGRRGPLEPPPTSPQGQALERQRAASQAKRGIVASPIDTSTNAEPLRSPADPLAPDDDSSAPEGEPQIRNLSQGQGETAFPVTAAPKTLGRKPPAIPRPNRPFVLDPLLD